MTEPNRRQQPAQQHRDLVATDDLGPGGKAIARRRDQISKVAVIVQTAARDFERLLPEHISPATFMTSAGAALWKSQDLMAGAIASPESFLIALRESAMLGHVPGTDHYWLTPRKDNRTPSVLGIEGYQGIIERMYRSGGVLSVHSAIVRERDTFEPYAGPNGRPLHQYGGKLGAFSKREERGEVIGVYAYAMLPGNVPSDPVLLSMEDLMEIKAFAATPKIWNLHPIPMFKKSALRRLEPFVPVSSGYRSSMAQAHAFVAAAAPMAALPQRMEDDPPPVADGDEVETVEGVVEERPDRPVTDVKFDPREWGGQDDPQWADLPVARPGEGVPEGVRGDG
jgi:recombination protein RecT